MTGMSTNLYSFFTVYPQYVHFIWVILLISGMIQYFIRQKENAFYYSCMLFLANTFSNTFYPELINSDRLSLVGQIHVRSYKLNLPFNKWKERLKWSRTWIDEGLWKILNGKLFNNVRRLNLELGCIVNIKQIDTFILLRDESSNINLHVRSRKNNRNPGQEKVLKLGDENKRLAMGNDMFKQAALFIGRR